VGRGVKWKLRSHFFVSPRLDASWPLHIFLYPDLGSCLEKRWSLYGDVASSTQVEELLKHETKHFAKPFGGIDLLLPVSFPLNI